MEPNASWTVLGLIGVLIWGQTVNAGLIQFNSCEAKLEYLCLGNLVSLVDQYEKNSAVFINDLEQRISDRVALSNSTHDIIVDNQRAAVISTISDLIDRIMSRLTENSNAGFQNCLKATLPLITYYQNTKMAAIGDCSSNSIVNISSDLTALKNLNATSTDSVNRLCDCVLSINTCSSSRVKAVAKGCALSNANSLSSAEVQKRANTIYSSVESKVLSTRSAVDQCISAIHLSSDRDVILSQINACSITTTTTTTTEPTTNTAPNTDTTP